MNNLSSFTELDKKDRVDFYIALATICCALVFILFYSFNFSSKSEGSRILNSSFSSIKLDDPIEVEDVKYIAVLEPIVSRSKIEKPAEIESVFPAIIVDSVSTQNFKEQGNSSINNTTITESSEAQLDIKEEFIDVVANVEESNSELFDTINIDSVKSEISVLERELIIEDTAETKAIVEIGDADKSCIIAVGLYSNKKNADRMAKRLDEGGFNSFITPRRSRYQVQVYHACNTVTINKSLTTIRSNYASDAVVLTKK